MLKIHQEDIDYDLYIKVSDGTAKSSLAMFLNIVVIFVAFIGHTNIYFLSLWALLGTLLLTLRSIDVYKYLQDKTRNTISSQTKKFKIYSILIALCVSAGISYLTPTHLPFHQAFLAMIVAGLSAGAAMALSYYQDLIRIYLSIMILPFAFLMLYQGGKIHFLIFFLMILFLIMIMLFSKKFEEAMRELIESKNEAHKQAHYDTITGLANRLTLYDRLAMEIQKIKRNKTQAAILFLDMDNFKNINDTYGHQVGDILLKKFAEIISLSTRTGDTFARLGGDEFVILLSNIETTNTKTAQDIAHKVAQKIHLLLETPIQIEEKELLVSVSIGIDIIDEFSKGLDDALNNADAAMYVSKKHGKNQTSFYQS